MRDRNQSQNQPNPKLQNLARKRAQSDKRNFWNNRQLKRVLLSRRPTAINHHSGARDHRAFVRRQIKRGSGNFFRFCHSPVQANTSAMAAPIPDAPPVTSAVLDSRLNTLCFHCLSRQLNAHSVEERSRADCIGVSITARVSLASNVALNYWEFVTG
jgi:hypothetical protein